MKQYCKINVNSRAAGLEPRRVKKTKMLHREFYVASRFLQARLSVYSFFMAKSADSCIFNGSHSLSHGRQKKIRRLNSVFSNCPYSARFSTGRDVFTSGDISDFGGGHNTICCHEKEAFLPSNGVAFQVIYFSLSLSVCIVPSSYNFY